MPVCSLILGLTMVGPTACGKERLSADTHTYDHTCNCNCDNTYTDIQHLFLYLGIMLIQEDERDAMSHTYVLGSSLLTVRRHSAASTTCRALPHASRGALCCGRTGAWALDGARRARGQQLPILLLRPLPGVRSLPGLCLLRQRARPFGAGAGCRRGWARDLDREPLRGLHRRRALRAWPAEHQHRHFP